MRQEKYTSEYVALAQIHLAFQAGEMPPTRCITATHDYLKPKCLR
jgi:hypothetical protein